MAVCDVLSVIFGAWLVFRVFLRCQLGFTVKETEIKKRSVSARGACVYDSVS